MNNPWVFTLALFASLVFWLFTMTTMPVWGKILISVLWAVPSFLIGFGIWIKIDEACGHE